MKGFAFGLLMKTSHLFLADQIFHAILLYLRHLPRTLILKDVFDIWDAIKPVNSLKSCEF